VITTPWAAVGEAVREIAAGGALDGIPLLDATNPIGPGFTLDVGPAGESGAERVQRLAPGAKVVKVFNTTGAENMRDPVYNGQRTMMLYAGDDAGAKRIAATLADSLGFEAIDAGGLLQARDLEHLAMIWIGLAFKGGMGRNFAFSVQRR
jgi:predicted dinucleotide-binding enzyme